MINSSPTIGADGSLYINAGNQLHALGPDGKLKWRFKTQGGGSSSPAIGSDGTIYVGVGERVYALLPDGKLKWKYLIGRRNISSPTLGADGTVYVGVGGGYLYALGPDASFQWKYKIGNRAASEPALAPDGTIYSGAGEGLSALSPQGELKWAFPTRGRVSAGPAIGADGTVYFGTEGGQVYALEQGGALRWQYSVRGAISTAPAIGADGTVYFGDSSAYVYAFFADGTLKWEYWAEGAASIEFVFVGSGLSTAPAIGVNGILYLGAQDGKVYALGQGGKLHWTFQTGGRVFSAPVIGADGVLYFGSWDTYLYAVDSADPTQPPVEAPDRATPFADGALLRQWKVAAVEKADGSASVSNTAFILIFGGDPIRDFVAQFEFVAGARALEFRGCNGCNGGYTHSQTGSISLRLGSCTTLACESQSEEALRSALGLVSSYEIHGDTLRLASKDQDSGELIYIIAVGPPKADFDGDGTVTLADFFRFADAFGGSDPQYDLDSSGLVDLDDFFLFADHFDGDAAAKLMGLAQEYLGLPVALQVAQNHPNPFNSSTIIHFSLPQSSKVTLAVYNLAGQRVATLVDGPREAGPYTVRWDGRDSQGQALASGVYLYRLQAGVQVETRKLVLVR